MFHLFKYPQGKPVIFFLTVILLSFYSCGPVHRFTRVKKIPGEHSLNYCGGDIKAPKTDLNKEPWIVYSDRDKNQTFNNPGGRVKAKDVGYLDPFLVIGKKGNFLKLVKYTPDILKNGKLDYKKAEYYGWIEKSKLLLNQQSVTDIASGRKNKMLAIFADTIPLNDPAKYFIPDSIRLYRDAEFQSQIGSILPYSIIYQYKVSEDGLMVLAGRKPYLKADDVKEDILGWIDFSLLKDIGTGLHLNQSTLPEYARKFLLHKQENISLTEDMINANYMIAEKYPAAKYDPVSSYSAKDTLAAFRTRIVLPVFDYSDNFIFNVDGGAITHKEYKAIAKSLKKVRVSFVFEGKQHTISGFPQIVNALQNLQAMLEEAGESLDLSFNTVMAFDETNRVHPLVTEFTSDYSALVNFLADKANSKDKLKPLTLPRTWSALRKAVELFDNSREDATNLIVLIGETGLTTGGSDPEDLARKLLRNNCRILGFQVYAGENDEYNNFVLDIESMINSYAVGMLKDKRKLLVSPSQIKRNNKYTAVSNEYNNGYRLDFPDNSITQGGIFFPQKSATLSMEVLVNNIDTLIQQISADNKELIAQMSQAFRSAGNNRTKFDSLFVRNFGLSPTLIPQKKLINSFPEEIPGWYLPSPIIVLEDSTDNKIDYRLMLSEPEMKDLKEFIATLSEKEVEYIYQVKQKKEQERKPCNCPEDDLFAEPETEKNTLDISGSDSILSSQHFYSGVASPGAYANTNKIRKYLTNLYLKPMRYCKVCKESKGKLQEMTLAEAQYRITGCPTSNELLHSIKIKDLKNKKKISDPVLEELIVYFKAMKKELDKAEQFESNGQIYYWADRKLLP